MNLNELKGWPCEMIATDYDRATNASSMKRKFSSVHNVIDYEGLQTIAHPLDNNVQYENVVAVLIGGFGALYQRYVRDNELAICFHTNDEEVR